MNKEINKITFFIFFVVLLIALIAFLKINKTELSQEKKTELSLNQQKSRTLKIYKEFSADQREEVVNFAINSKRWKIGDSELFLHCVGDYSFKKIETLKFMEVMEWCNNESIKNRDKFESHFNELNRKMLENEAYVFTTLLIEEKLKEHSDINFLSRKRVLKYKGRNKYYIKVSTNSYKNGIILKNSWVCNMTYNGYGDSQDISNWRYKLEKN